MDESLSDSVTLSVFSLSTFQVLFPFQQCAKQSRVFEGLISNLGLESLKVST